MNNYINNCAKIHLVLCIYLTQRAQHLFMSRAKCLGYIKHDSHPVYTPCSKKVCHKTHGGNFVKS